MREKNPRDLLRPTHPSSDMSRARHSSRDIEFDLPGALDDMAGLASKAAIGHGARDVEVFGNGRQGRPAERQSCDVQPPPAASKKDTVVIISTNNPGRLMLFAALNPKLGEVCITASHVSPRHTKPGSRPSAPRRRAPLVAR